MIDRDKIKIAMDKAIENGWTCNIDTGEVYSSKGKIANRMVGGYMRCIYIIKGITYGFQAHHFIYYIATGKAPNIIDHLNGNKVDNRISNLSNGTTSENCQNRRNAKGYYFDKKSKKWVAYIYLNDKHIHLGAHLKEEDARQAYLNGKKIYHPKKSYLFCGQ